jgi:probable rRNA maturation factor
MTGASRRTASRNTAARNSATASQAPRRARFVIDVRNEQAYLSFPAGRIRRIARAVLEAEHVAEATISVALVDNRAIHRLNRRHLQHDYATDVLSFLFESQSAVPDAQGTKGAARGKGCRIDGEIVISAEMALESAARFGVTPIEELTLYLVHGLLHLCGYDDQTSPERRLMRKRERAILNLLRD